MTKNFEEVSIDNPAKIENGQAYIDINLFKDIYNVKVEYNEKTTTISIDKKSTADIPVKYNNVKVYEDISTKSSVIDTIDKNRTVTVYSESLNHNRWYKVKTNSGIIGYIPKNNVDFVDNKDEINESDNKEDQKSNKKITMFWQYGSNLKTLGDKIEGVDVVSPTWYELQNTSGEISSKFSQDYYNKAKANGYEIWPIITNGIDSTNYMPGDTSAMLNSEQSRENFIKNLLKIAKNNKLDGINIDFESMESEDKYLYTEFLRELYPMVKQTGAKLSVDIYFTGYIDRMGVGKACDYVILMGYDQRGNWSKEAGSISEISWVENNVSSLINDSKIPSNKIILGVPFYTRLWMEESDGTLTTKTYSMNNSQEFLDKYNLTPNMDNISGQNYVAVELGNIMYKLWIEDAQSMEKRADTVLKYDLAGISAWQRGFETEDIWQILKNKLKEK